MSDSQIITFLLDQINRRRKTNLLTLEKVKDMIQNPKPKRVVKPKVVKEGAESSSAPTKPRKPRITKSMLLDVALERLGLSEEDLMEELKTELGSP